MINFSNRLTKLKDRRQGTAERNRLEKGFTAIGADIRTSESYESLKENDAIRYVVGSMAPVSPESTRISVEEGERVANTLIELLNTEGISTTKRMQGSVALDIHIEGHSDVDMLILKEDIITYETPAIDSSMYSPASDPRSMVDMVKEIRIESERKLTSRYYAANVDCSGSKSIALSGGSLRRKVDIVPSSWYDTLDYQRTRQESDRTVRIYHKDNHQLLDNKPFLHIKNVNDRDAQYNGNLKKAVRLMKNLVADMPDYKKSKAKKLSSYDLTGIAYAMDKSLDCNPYLPLALLENLRSYLLILLASEVLRDLLEVPDKTRKIFNEESKVEALSILAVEVNELALEVQKSLRPLATTYDSSVLNNKVVVW
ncbi:hypothetical protein [Vibrio parahaemolyticus]|uniref:hypothetical protein n=1 Tax=Vibrio parahaemolyticus TaxID=670 RepID=UPI0009F13CF3|nr:hypothetical protein [Vibrio parahaemolyticus]EGQ7877817.1 hypothetical protein [Vibrio parahaemolyticus]EGR9058757.1 hypothetical protein [Vibrio parahaemolyticus]EHK2884645.1 hypothetical protein [Vibrio parahaemolyticus]EHW8641216.1 hypothetical protein [Vibrio parahaemolyticus]EIU6775929.1 hypothetical protein [Vibrio parahaemolyticus]